MQPANKLKIESLIEEWCDNDYVMLHACFQLLKDCVEKEELLGHIDWNYDDKHRKTKAELDALYSWWLERIKAEVNDNLMDEDEQYKQDDLMLHRLITIRRALWT